MGASIYRIRMQAHRLRRSGQLPTGPWNRMLYDGQHPGLEQEVVSWREDVDVGLFDPSDSAGFYWSLTGMAKYADEAHEIQRQAVTAGHGIKIYYRSPAFWRASATVNLQELSADEIIKG